MLSLSAKPFFLTKPRFRTKPSRARTFLPMLSLPKLLPALAASLLACASLPALNSAAAAQTVGVESASSAMLSKRLTLGVGRAIVIGLPADASEVVVADPKVANAVVRSARKIYVMGIGNGQTTILALDREGRQIANLELNIGRDIDDLAQILKTALPRAAIVVKRINESVVLTGTVDSAGEAANAVEIAKAFSSRSGAGAAAPGAAASADGGIVNSLVIRGRDQVMVKVTIAEVQRNILKQLGVSTGSTGDTILKTGWATLTQQNSFSLNGTLSPSALSVPVSSTTALTLQAYERYGVSRVLAEPTVTAVSGESAKFTVGGEIPVPQSSTCTPQAAAGLQPICTIGVAFKQYGVTLNMTPVVLAEGRILVRMATEVTELDSQSSVIIGNVAVPGFRTRKNETTVELPSGGSMATAGLMTNNSRNAINGLPGLINLPILGALFRSRDYQRQETELLVVVTPYIARPTAPNELVRPDDGYSDATDPQAWLLGRVNKLYSTRSNPQAIENFKGRVGFIQD